MLLDIAQDRPREQGFDAWRTSAEMGGGHSPLEREITCDATDTPPSRAESAVLRR